MSAIIRCNLSLTLFALHDSLLIQFVAQYGAMYIFIYFIMQVVLEVQKENTTIKQK